MISAERESETLEVVLVSLQGWFLHLITRRCKSSIPIGLPNSTRLPLCRVLQQEVRDEEDNDVDRKSYSLMRRHNITHRG